jgi:hypothetical protein
VPTDQGKAGGRSTFNNQELGSCPRAAVDGVDQAGGMEIIIDIHLPEEGGPAGTAQATGSSDARLFYGNLEFIGVMESPYRAEDRFTISAQSPKKEQDSV